MMKKKLTLEDLKLESFLTELDDTKLKKVQGGNSPYDGYETKDCGNDKTDVDGSYNPGGYPEGNSPETKLQDCKYDTAQDCTGAQGC